MIKVYLQVNAVDGQYQFAPAPAQPAAPDATPIEQRSYANALKVGAYDGSDIVMVYTAADELAYLQTCTGYLGDAEQLKENNPEIYNAIEPIIFAGETINNETEGE